MSRKKNISFYPLDFFLWFQIYMQLVLPQVCVRQQYLYGTMEKGYSGPYCKEINLSSEQLNSIDTTEPLKHDCVKNGVVFEIQKICKNSTEILTILKHIQPALFEPANIAALKSKLNRLTDTREICVEEKSRATNHSVTFWISHLTHLYQS